MVDVEGLIAEQKRRFQITLEKINDFHQNGEKWTTERCEEELATIKEVRKQAAEDHKQITTFAQEDVMEGIYEKLKRKTETLEDGIFEKIRKSKARKQREEVLDLPELTQMQEDTLAEICEKYNDFVQQDDEMEMEKLEDALMKLEEKISKFNEVEQKLTKKFTKTQTKSSMTRRISCNRANLKATMC